MCVVQHTFMWGSGTYATGVKSCTSAGVFIWQYRSRVGLGPKVALIPALVLLGPRVLIA